MSVHQTPNPALVRSNNTRVLIPLTAVFMRIRQNLQMASASGTSASSVILRAAMLVRIHQAAEVPTPCCCCTRLRIPLTAMLMRIHETSHAPRRGRTAADFCPPGAPRAVGIPQARNTVSHGRHNTGRHVPWSVEDVMHIHKHLGRWQPRAVIQLRSSFSSQKGLAHGCQSAVPVAHAIRMAAVQCGCKTAAA